MRNALLFLTFCMSLLACGNVYAQNNKAVAADNSKNRIEILYFHGRQRCATCLAIEKNTKEALETQFANELKNGTVVFKTIDISKAANKKIAEKYEVTWSSLFICKWENGKESYENLTEYAFANARTAPDTFKTGLIERIKKLIDAE